MAELNPHYVALVEEVAGILHRDDNASRYYEAARAFLRGTGVSNGVEVENAVKAKEVLLQFLHWLLNENHHQYAAKLLWSPIKFTYEPEATRRTWRAFETQSYILLMGAASMSKSYSMGVRLMLEWISDPENTTVQVLGPSENHLKDNLFSHLVDLHQCSSLPLPGTPKDLFIGMNPKVRSGAIRGVIVPLGKKGAGRIQGTKRTRRTKIHPKYGKSTRMFVFLDEMVNIPKGIWRDIDNIMANTQVKNDPGMKIIGAFNPTDQNDEVGKRCEPPTGWLKFDPDQHFEWMSTRGWWVVRLDAKYSENVQSGKVIYEGLQTLDGYNLIIRNSGGTDSQGYWAMCRGCFPPLGVTMSVVPGGMLNKFKGEFIWQETPTDVAGVDLALSGKDKAIFAKGKFGLASGIRLPPTLDKPSGETIFFKNEMGAAAPRYALQLEALHPFPKADTVAMAEAVIALCKQTHVRPQWLCMDRTGNGQGVFDIVRDTWGHEVRGINFSENATKQKIMHEDSSLPEDRYDRVQTELWFALRAWIEFDYMKAIFPLELAEFNTQVGTRQYKANGKVSKVESKDDYQERQQCRSPDEADAVTLMVHCVRMTGGIVLGMTPGNTSAAPEESDPDYDTQRIDVTNRTEDIDD